MLSCFCPARFVERISFFRGEIETEKQVSMAILSDNRLAVPRESPVRVAYGDLSGGGCIGANVLNELTPRGAAERRQLKSRVNCGRRRSRDEREKIDSKTYWTTQ